MPEVTKLRHVILLEKSRKIQYKLLFRNSFIRPIILLIPLWGFLMVPLLKDIELKKITNVMTTLLMEKGKLKMLQKRRGLISCKESS